MSKEKTQRSKQNTSSSTVGVFSGKPVPTIRNHSTLFSTVMVIVDAVREKIAVVVENVMVVKPGEYFSGVR